jgi:hypothetical protein
LKPFAAGESPTAEDAYEPSPLASSTRSTKQIDLWMDLVDIRDDTAAFKPRNIDGLVP